MKAEKIGARPLRFSERQRKQVSTQFGAICWRRNKRGKLRVMLVTSRGTGRWLVPKGWPMDGKTPAETAALEAFEEAGVSGIVGTDCVGLYTYTKAAEGKGDDLPCAVALYPLEVSKKHAFFPERHQRKRRWMSRRKAAKRVDEPDLKAILKAFDPG